MTRVPLVAGNWKMNGTIKEALELVDRLRPDLDQIEAVETLVCPPFTALSRVSESLSGSKITLGAQNLYWEPSGAYTGEISPLMVRELCTHVIIGHSERRAYFHETDETVNKRIVAALETDLIPILCVGETLEEREAGRTHQVVHHQLQAAIEGITLKTHDEIVIAYEPVWAIGTGMAATSGDANEVILESIRTVLTENFEDRLSQSIRVLYGGSVKTENARVFFEESEIDGALVGGASLKAEAFIQIVHAAHP